VGDWDGVIDDEGVRDEERVLVLLDVIEGEGVFDEEGVWDGVGDWDGVIDDDRVWDEEGVLVLLDVIEGEGVFDGEGVWDGVTVGLWLGGMMHGEQSPFPVVESHHSGSGQ